MKTLILCGKSGAGKTTVGLALEKQGYKKIVTYTTRPKRNGEVDGVDYNFVTENEFESLVKTGAFAETAEYNATFGYCRYGSLKSDYEREGKKYIILNPIGLKQVLSAGVDAFTVYLYANNAVLENRLQKRKDKLSEITRRLKTDEEDFKDILAYADLTVGTEYTPEEIAGTIIKFMEARA